MQVGSIETISYAAEVPGDPYPSSVGTFDRHQTFDCAGTFYGYVWGGTCLIMQKSEQGIATLQIDPGSFFSVPGPCEFILEEKPICRLWLVHREGFRGMFTAGFVEDTGRLQYIDGAQATTLINPIRSGDPTLQHLFLPPGVIQTLHSHPTTRHGLVINGRLTIRGGKHGKEEHKLKKGSMFTLAPHELHQFQTIEGESAEIVAFHPDSDFGPTDDDHPMLNRTIIR